MSTPAVASGFGVLRSFARPHLRTLLLGLALAVAGSATGLAIPLATGLLTGKYRRGQDAAAGTRMSDGRWASYFTSAPWDTIENLERYAAQRGRSILDIAFGGLLARPGVSSVIAGATTPEQVRANVAAASWTPSTADLEELDAITAAIPAAVPASLQAKAPHVPVWAIPEDAFLVAPAVAELLDAVDGTLVKGDAVGVRAVVGVASALLALSVVEAFRPDGVSWYDGFWGVVAVVFGALALARGRGRSTSRRPAGAHAR